MHRTALALLVPVAFACTNKRPQGTLPGDGGGRDGNVVNPGDGGVITPPDGSVVNAIYDDCPDFEHTLDVPIIVNDEQNAIARDPSITSFLVPFAREGAVFSLNSLVVYDGAGARLPAQFETISRWGGGPDDCTVPIRYAYAHVRAAPPAGSREQWSVKS